MENGNGHRDVLIRAFPAGAGARAKGLQAPELSPDLREMVLREELARAVLDVERFRNVATLMANVALCFAHTLNELNALGANDGVVTIPRWLSDKVTGLAVTVAAPEGQDLRVTIREASRTGAPVVWEA